MLFQRMAQRRTRVDFVTVAPALAVAFQHARGNQVRDDTLGGALGNADVIGDAAQRGSRFGSQTDQHVGMVRQKRLA